MGDHYGDQINMYGGNIQIAKIVGRDAAEELGALISLLQRKGATDAQGNVIDGAAVTETVNQERGRLANLREAVRNGLGPVVQAATAGTVAQLIVQSLK
ncbi:hypothetical protein [Micromonospora sp. WMMD708]|uniref:hypothetical protein n=1 Tax=Micromonospora sp. WMMD708 TaxID=3403464 RepID=UPI003BF522BA